MQRALQGDYTSMNKPRIGASHRRRLGRGRAETRFETRRAPPELPALAREALAETRRPYEGNVEFWTLTEAARFRDTIELSAL